MFKLNKASLAIALTGTMLLAGCNSSSDEFVDNPLVPDRPTPDLPPERPSPEPEEIKGFTVVMMPDTQKYTRYAPWLFDAQTAWIAENYEEQKIVFTAHLGDVVDLPRSDYEWTNARSSMLTLEVNPETPYSVLAGNHDVLSYQTDGINNNTDYDIQRNLLAEPYLHNFGPERQAGNYTTFRGADTTGFNTYHIFEGDGREYLMLAMDWRPSDVSFEWAQSILDQYPDTPTFITTHQLMNIGGDGETAVFTELGAKFWDELIKNNDQVFMAVNGHHHGEAIGVVITTISFFAHGSLAKFASPNDERILQ